MGSAEAADSSRIPDFPSHVDPSFSSSFGLIPVRGNYQLIGDNLLDLSHAQFLHPLLVVPDGKQETEFLQQDDSVTQTLTFHDTKKASAFAMFWPEAPERLDAYGTLRWEAPGYMWQSTILTPVGQPERPGIRLYLTHFAVPETATTSHYFWSVSRDFRRDDTAYGDQLHTLLGQIFTREDGWIIGLVQENMGSETDIIALRAAVLSSDKCTMRARLIMKRLLLEEREAGQRTLDC
jgi:vanillate O-demethylase monooxygenase subunit